MTARHDLLSLARGTRATLSLFVKDIGQGLLVVSHNSLALLGLAVVALGLVFVSQADLRQDLEGQALGWLNAREEARAQADGNTLFAVSEPNAVDRATAADPKDLPRQQAAVAMWLSRRYKVAPEPISRLVQEAWVISRKAQLEPTLILAIMAVESSFNPFAQSPVGAQGLMQVMTHVHNDKYEAFGGNLAAFDPITNLRVGVQVLKECIQRAGSLDEGLRYYVGAANLPDDTGYAAKVLELHEQMKSVATGRPVQAKPIRETSPMASATPLASADTDVTASKVALVQ